MDILLIIALALFVVLVAAWVALPATSATVVSDQDAAPAPLGALQQS